LFKALEQNAYAGRVKKVNPERPPKLSDGALYLLEIARENDRYRVLEKNAAFVKVLDFGEELIRVCKREGLEGLFLLLRATPPPQDFLTITAAALHEIRNRTDEYVHAGTPGASPVRDFDRHALQGFAEALADLAWPNRNASDFDGPASEVFVSRLAQNDPHTMWMRTLQHYLANIFQDNFAALRMRERVPELDPATEVDLRLVDARLLAEHAMKLYKAMQSDKDDPEVLAFALYQAINETLGGRSG